MRWIAVLLLLLNAGYFGWSHFLGGSLFGRVDSVRIHSEQEGLRTVPTLILLSEQLLATKAREVGGLRSEGEGYAHVSVAAPVDSQMPLAQRAQPVLVCREIGPWSLKGDAVRVKTFLEEQAVESVVLKEQKISEEKTYWLSLPLSGASGSLDARMEKVERVGLTARQMREGRLAGKVAAGPFVSYEVAESYLFRLVAVGVDVAIEPVVDVGFQYWLVVEWMYEPGFAPPSSILDDFLAPLEKEFAKELQQNACS